MTHAPQGWYPDPSGQSTYRHWDGEKWSSVTSDNPSLPEAVPLTSPIAKKPRHWGNAIGWMLMIIALLVQLVAIGVLAAENRALESHVRQQRQEIENLTRKQEEEMERRQQEAQTRATAWCEGVSVENRQAVPKLFLEYQSAERLTQEATQEACADRVAIAHAVSVVDFSLHEAVAIDECSQLPGEDVAVVRGTVDYSGPLGGDNISAALAVGDVWIDVTLVGAQSVSPPSTTHIEAISPGQERSWELTLPFAGVTDIHSCHVHSISWWPSSAL